MNNIDVMDKGMKCLLEKLGVVETEQFISFMIREKFDYTEWQREKFDGVKLDVISADAVEYEKEHPISLRNK